MIYVILYLVYAFIQAVFIARIGLAENEDMEVFISAVILAPIATLLLVYEAVYLLIKYKR